MKKTIGKSILAAIAVGLVSISYVSADTVAQSVSINHSEAASKSKNVTPNMNNASPIKQIPRMQLVGWPIMTQDSARNFKGIAEVTQKLPYEAEAPSYIPYGYEIAQRLTHLFIIYSKITVVHPVFSKAFPICSFTLCYFIFVVWKNQVFTTGMYIYLLSKIPLAHN